MGGHKDRGIVGTCWAPTLTGSPSTAVLLRTTCAPFCRNLSWTWSLYVGANHVGKPEWWMGLLPAKSREKHWAGNKARQTTYDSFIMFYQSSNLMDVGCTSFCCHWRRLFCLEWIHLSWLRLGPMVLTKTVRSPRISIGVSADVATVKCPDPLVI